MKMLWNRALEDVRIRAGVPVAFGGEVEADGLRLAHFVGTRTTALDGLSLPRGSGLGGRVWNEATPMTLDDYESALGISHEHDEPVLREGLRGVAAVPVRIGLTTRAVLYAGTRHGPGHGDALRDVLVSVARRLARDMAIEDEVARRVMVRSAAAAEAEERLRWLQTELRGVRSRSDDPAVVRELTHLIERSDTAERTLSKDLTARQVDVLSCVAQGASYRVVARRLGLSDQTVKAYMRDILAALGAHSRHEAVVSARRRGLIF